ncbi:MAG: hypothetical protein ABS949_09585 [Solibacillus sp.]
MEEAKRSNGNKVAMVIIGSIIGASIVCVIVILLFFEMYNPEDYGRTNGGIDYENTGIPDEAQEQLKKISN